MNLRIYLLEHLAMHYVFIYTKITKYSTRNIIFYKSILSYRALILSYRACMLFYRACILSYRSWILSCFFRL